MFVDTNDLVSTSFKQVLDQLMVFVVVIKALHSTQISEKCRSLAITIKQVIQSMIPIFALIIAVLLTFTVMSFIHLRNKILDENQ